MLRSQHWKLSPYLRFERMGDEWFALALNDADIHRFRGKSAEVVARLHDGETELPASLHETASVLAANGIISGRGVTRRFMMKGAAAGAAAFGISSLVAPAAHAAQSGNALAADGAISEFYDGSTFQSLTFENLDAARDGGQTTFTLRKCVPTSVAVQVLIVAGGGGGGSGGASGQGGDMRNAVAGPCGDTRSVCAPFGGPCSFQGDNGRCSGGGGGGGGVRVVSTTVATETVTILVGHGGQQGLTGGQNFAIASRRGKNGGQSAFGGLTASGGGGGGVYCNANATNAAGLAGGSGGGGSGSETAGATGGNGTSGGSGNDIIYGNAGGTGSALGGTGTARQQGSGGGGGAGVGGSDTSGDPISGGKGGDGIEIKFRFGENSTENQFYGGGGGGGDRQAGLNNSQPAGAGGEGGGGQGQSNTTGGDGEQGRGGGGGGTCACTGCNAEVGGHGGSGIVVVRWQYFGARGVPCEV